MDDNDIIRIIINHPASDHPINLHLKRRDQLDAKRIISEIGPVLLSNEGSAIDFEFAPYIIKVHLLRGHGHLDRNIAIYTLLCKERSLVTIKTMISLHD